MTRKSASFLLIAGSGAVIQASTTIAAFAWLSRCLSLSEVGRFGLYLAITSLAIGLDGIRQPIVVTAISRPSDSIETISSLCGLSYVAGTIFALALLLASPVFGLLAFGEAAPLAVTTFLVFAVGPGLACLEARHGAHYSSAVHSLAWSIATAAAALAAGLSHDVTLAAYCVVVAPALAGLFLFSTGHWVRPRFSSNRKERNVACQGVGSHLVTAIGGFLDKGALAVSGNPMLLGLYTPASEMVSRASSLAGLVTNLFLRDETRFAFENITRLPGTTDRHHKILFAFVCLACASLIVASLAASVVLETLFAQTNPEQLTAWRILLVCLALNVGAHWSAVTLKARGEFDLYRTYGPSLVAAALLSPLLVSSFGIIGAALLVLVLRVGDVALLLRSRRYASNLQTTLVLGTSMALLLLAVMKHG